ncbi:MAG: hypothetical protein EOP45_12830 [Sphingobacteriaceae bacterium]|nr:MAG: hypothetical protein EOP45_12830 [Sphingobacteriaceae bacterium]
MLSYFSDFPRGYNCNRYCKSIVTNDSPASPLTYEKVSLLQLFLFLEKTNNEVNVSEAVTERSEVKSKLLLL